MNIATVILCLGKDDREELQIEEIIKGVSEHYQKNQKTKNIQSEPRNCMENFTSQSFLNI